MNKISLEPAPDDSACLVYGWTPDDSAYLVYSWSNGKNTSVKIYDQDTPIMVADKLRALAQAIETYEATK